MPRAMSAITRSSLFVTIILFFMVCLFTQNITVAQSNNYYHFCPNSTKLAFASHSLYQSNLNDLFLKLLSNANIEGQGFWNTSVGNITTPPCTAATSAVTTLAPSSVITVFTMPDEILRQCPNNPSAIIWYDDCMLRYSNENFFGIIRAAPFWYVYSINSTADSRKVENVDDFTSGLVVNATMDKSKTLFAANEFNVSGNEKWYGLVQCSRDINSSDCHNCLESLLNTRPEPRDRLGMQLLAPSCLVMRDSFLSFNRSTTPVPQPNPGRKKGASKLMIALIISITAILVAALSACCYCLWWRNKNDGLQPTADFVLRGHPQI